MDPGAVSGLLEAIAHKAEDAAIPVADAMAITYKRHLQDVTLTESGSHPPVTQTPAPEGRPPAQMPGGLHGSLRDSIERSPTAGGGGVAESAVFPTVIYAGTQEYGGVHTGNPWMWLWVGFIGKDAVYANHWVKHTVHIPSRPYMRTATAETLANGELHRAAEAAFIAATGL